MNNAKILTIMLLIGIAFLNHLMLDAMKCENPKVRVGLSEKRA